MERGELLAAVETLSSSGETEGEEEVYLKEMRMWKEERAVRTTKTWHHFLHPQLPFLPVAVIGPDEARRVIIAAQDGGRPIPTRAHAVRGDAMGGEVGIGRVGDSAREGGVWRQVREEVCGAAPTDRG